ncbi:unnamed protein product, partial [Polarella glacialis]
MWEQLALGDRAVELRGWTYCTLPDSQEALMLRLRSRSFDWEENVPKLHWRNWANLLAYLANLTFAYLFVCMLGILGSLLGLLLTADGVRMSPGEYWILRVPFSLHAGWVLT